MKIAQLQKYVLYATIANGEKKAAPATDALGANRKGTWMGSSDTMALLGDTLIELSERAPLEKISISNIVDASGKNRKTFYYHFDSKEALVHWTFRRDMASMLLQHANPDTLVYETQGAGTYPTLPYYVRKKIGVRSLDGSPFILSLAACFELRRSYYAKALRPVGADSLRAYLKRLYTPAMEDDVLSILSNRYLPRNNVRFLAEFYVGALVSYFAERVIDPSCTDLVEDMGPFDNLVHSSLEWEIKEQQLRRNL